MKLKTQLIGLILNYKYVVTVFCILIISIRLSAQNSDALQLVNTLGFSSIFNIAINQVDGRVAASGRDTLWIYDEVFDHQQEIRIDGVIDDVAWSQDGNYLAVAYNFGLQEQRILVIDADDFSSVNTLVSTDSWSEERLKIAFSPNNQKIAISTNSGAIVWDFSADTTLQLQATSGLSTIDLDWSPDGTKVVGVNLSGSVYVWNSTTAQSIGSFVAPTGLLAVDWSATNSYIVIGGFDSYLATIDTTNFQLIFAFTYPDSAVSDVLTLDGSLIVISQEGNVYVYNAANHNLERQANVGNQILVEFSIKGTNNQLVFLTASSSLYTYSIATLEELSAYVAHGQSITAFDWSNSGNLIATGSLDGLLKLWEFDETTAHPTVFLLNSGSVISAIDWSSDDTRLAIGSDSGVEILNISNQIGQTLGNGLGAVDSVAWNSNNQYLAIVQGNQISIWDVQAGQMNDSWILEDGSVNQVAWHPLQNLLAITTSSNDIYLWDRASSDYLWNVKAHNDFISALAWNSDGTTIATGGDEFDSTVQFWNAITGDRLATFDTQAGVYALNWSDSNTLSVATASHSITLLKDQNNSIQLVSESVLPHQITRGNDARWNRTSEFLSINTLQNIEIFGESSTPELADISLQLDYGEIVMTNYETINIDSFSSPLQFRANTNPQLVGSVEFELNGQLVFTDDTAPYIYEWPPTLGVHTMTATPYSGAGGTGTAGTPLTINFTVTNSLNRILYVHNSNIYVMNADGTNTVHLVAGDSPSWSPDGTRIAYHASMGGSREIFVMNADGSNILRLTNNAADDRNPSWSPDGSRLVYASVVSGSDWELYIMNVDGTNKVQLTNNVVDDTDPSWSSNGVIVFVAMPEAYKQIYTILPNGSQRTRLTNSASNTVAPEWSPDGSMIVYNTTGGTNDDIHRINANGTGHLRLTSNASSDISADWSQDGTQIIFSSDRAGGTNRELYIMNSDGSSQTRFSFTSGPNEMAPAWGYP